MKEADVSGIFSSFGIVEECVVLRDNSGLSKGLCVRLYVFVYCRY